MTRRWWALAVLFVLLAGLVPYRELLWHLPWGADATKWVMYASTDYADWWGWATDRKHFVGYRPITALSFVLNQATTGYEPWGYRGLDLALHVLAGLLLFGTYRALTGRDNGWGLVAVVVLLGHPATEEVLPYVARRSYLLAAVLGLGSLNAFVRGVRSERWGWSAAAGVLLALAVLSNEVAYVLLPLLPLVALHLVPRWRSLLHTLPAMALCGLAIVQRYLVLGVWGGGYRKRYFAFLLRDKPMWRELQDWQPRRIAEACWSYTLDPHSVSGHPALLDGTIATWVVGALLLWGLGTCFVRPVLRYDEPEGRLPALLGVWMLGATAIVVLSQTWFWRQAYMLLPPLGILLALVLDDAVKALRERRWLQGLHVVPAALLVVLALYNGPLLRGMDRSVHAARIHGTEVVGELRALTDGLQGPGRVWMVVPMRASAAHIVRTWGDRFGASRDIEFRLLAHLAKQGLASKARVALVEGPEGPTLVLEEGFDFSRTGQVTAVLEAPDRLPLARLYKRKRRDWVAVTGAGGGLLEEVPAP